MDAVKLMKPGEDADIEVGWEDQNKINKFSNLNVRMSELEERVVHLKRAIEEIQDAENELELVLSDDELEDEFADVALEEKKNGRKAFNVGVPLLIGDCFVNFDLEGAKERLSQMKAKKNNDMDALKKEMSSIDKEMGELKSSLYKRFGNSIQLEREL
jgi:prefoldin subunit 4